MWRDHPLPGSACLHVREGGKVSANFDMRLITKN
jgi:hypothetical protein